LGSEETLAGVQNGAETRPKTVAYGIRQYSCGGCLEVLDHHRPHLPHQHQFHRVPTLSCRYNASSQTVTGCLTISAWSSGTYAHRLGRRQQLHPKCWADSRQGLSTRTVAVAVIPLNIAPQWNVYDKGTDCYCCTPRSASWNKKQ
jgi:hypothetical protein